MKKFLVLPVVAGFVVCMIAHVYAADTEFGGQYRINYYNADRGDDTKENQAAARLRFRPHVNTTFNENVSAHLQLEIGHISSNEGTLQSSVETRHAYLQFKPDACPVECTVKAGIIPWSDSFGDTLASSDWDFNPLGIGGAADVGGGKLRIGTYKTSEWSEEPAKGKEDDIDLLTLDYDKELAKNVSVGVSYYNQTDQGAGTETKKTWIGVRGCSDIGNVKVNGFYLTSKGDYASASAVDTSGNVIKLEGKVPIANTNLSVMVVSASGSTDGKKNVSLEEAGIVL
ncbi:MAG: hypothetical protein AAB267_07580, partial [Candidatus Desantisbacteria bacterium]